MVATKTISYADRAKNGRPSTGNPVAKPSPITTTANANRSAKAIDADYPVLTGKSEDDGFAGTPSRAVNEVAWPNDHSAASSDFATQTASTTLNGSDTSPSTPSTPPSVAATPPSAKPNVWTVRKELMNAVRTGPAAPPHNAASAKSNRSLPPTKAQSITPATDPHTQSPQPSASVSQSKSKRSAIPSDSGKTQSPATNQTQMTTPTVDHSASVAPASAKKKTNAKSVTPSAQSTPVESPIPPLDETSSWPAPQEAAAVGNGPTVRRDSHTAGSEDNKQGPSAHSRESSTVGSAHGKKQQWLRMPAAELQEAVDAANPPSPHQLGAGRGKRGPDGERRSVAGRAGPGGGARSSGRNSKRSSAAPSPATRPNGLPSSGSATTPTLNANATPFSSKILPNQIYGQPGQRSHPHSPIGRSPFLSSHPQSLVNSPRIGGGYSSPRRGYPLQNNHLSNAPQYNRSVMHPPQSSVVIPMPNRARLRRKAPSKSSPLTGAIPELRFDNSTYRPTFGTVEPAAQPGMGLGLSVPSEVTGTVSELPHPSQVAGNAVRWDETSREPTEAEKILRAEGKFGIGTTEAGVPAPDAAQEEAVVAEQEVPSVVVGNEAAQATDEQERPEPKLQWSFGSVDRPNAEPSPTPTDILVVDPSRRPPYTMPFSGSPGPNDMNNGYGQYDNINRGSPLYGGNRGPGGDGGYGEGAPNGYSGHRGFGGRRGRGGSRPYGNRSNYGPRQPMVNANPSGAYYSNSPIVPQQPPQPQPDYAGYGYGMYYPPPPPPMDYNPYGYPDPYSAPPPHLSATAAPPPTPVGAPSGDSSPYMMMPPYGYPGYPPPPPGMVNPMMGYYYPPPGPPSFYPPPPSMPPAGYQMDETRASILRQVEFYLSYQNMTQDTFLRSRMDSQGWLDVELIASFNRLRRITSDVNLVREMMHVSAVIEVTPDGQKCRMANNTWQMFIAPPPLDGVPLQFSEQDVQPQFGADALLVHQPPEAVQHQSGHEEEQAPADAGTA